MTTIFAKILKGEVPGSFVYRDEKVSAFMDVGPIAPGHVIVLPNQEVSSLAELDEETGSHLFRIGQRIAKALRVSGLQCEGVTLWLADGEAAGQEVPCVHLHVFPRVKGDGLGWPLSRNSLNFPGRAELERTAEAIKLALEKLAG